MGNMNFNIAAPIYWDFISKLDRSYTVGVFNVLLSKAVGYSGLAYVDTITALLSRYDIDPDCHCMVGCRGTNNTDVYHNG